MKQGIDNIIVYHAKENNLKDLSFSIPKNKFIVFTGLSGSGKSTLAFDTLYAEGQRRYIESLSSYARQFLDKVGKPNVEKIEGLTPAIAIDQKTTSKNPRSTVGTITEIYDYMRLLYARVGVQHCHICGEKISHMSQTDIIEQVLKLPEDSTLFIYAPIIKEKKGTFADKLQALCQKGYVRAQIDGVMTRLDEEIELSKSKKHSIYLVIDRVKLRVENHIRIAQAIEKALKESFGEVEVDVLSPSKGLEDGGERESTKETRRIHYSEHFACFNCKISFEELNPLSFSFNSPSGSCPDCLGLGSKFNIDVKKIIDSTKPLRRGGIKLIFGYNKNYYAELFDAFCEHEKIDSKKTFYELDSDTQAILLYGSAREFEMKWRTSKLTRTWKGIIPLAYEMLKDDVYLQEYTAPKICSTCSGHRLNQQSLHVRVANKGIGELLDMSIEQLLDFFGESSNFYYFTSTQEQIAAPILKEITERLKFLNEVGLNYLTLGRDARTISGGESQRIRIASQIGSGLSGVMYVLDEPSIGLHERDTLRLIKTLRSLQEKGNTLIIVEHDRETIMNADYIVDIGPGAGANGGEIVFSGTIDEMLKSKTLSAKYINGELDIMYRAYRKQEKFLSIKNVNINNIKNLSVQIPLSNFVCICGVSGSGKSSLILQTLLPCAQEILNNARKVQKVDDVEVEGLENLNKVIYLDQNPIGRTPRSNPATYTGVMDHIRALFAEVKESKIRGYAPGRFSFNVKGGRCEKCQGEGEIKIAMHFLPDVLVTCDVCGGKKYNAQTLEILYKGKNIYDVLCLSVDEACDFFEKVPRIAQILKTLQKVGLGYITLNQSALSLSGGEAQRIKLAKELSRSDTGKTLYILDEPTTGLHFADVDKLVNVLHHLVELGNSVIVIEHNLDLIKNADYIIDIGPEGGAKGGKVVDCGTPEELAANAQKSASWTGKFLASELARKKQISELKTRHKSKKKDKIV